jgi:hypothetical protein
VRRLILLIDWQKPDFPAYVGRRNRFQVQGVDPLLKVRVKKWERELPVKTWSNLSGKYALRKIFPRKHGLKFQLHRREYKIRCRREYQLGRHKWWDNFS